MRLVDEPLEPGEAELRALWNAMPQDELDPARARTLPERVLREVERRDRSRRTWRIGTAAAAALLPLALLYAASLDSVSPSQTPKDPPTTVAANAPIGGDPVRERPEQETLEQTPHETQQSAPQPTLGTRGQEPESDREERPGTQTLLVMHRQLTRALAADHHAEVSRLAEELLAIDGSSLPRSGHQSWRSSLARWLQFEARREDAEEISPSHENGLRQALALMEARDLENFVVHDLRELSPHLAQSVAAELLERGLHERLLSLGLQREVFASPALAALEHESGRDWLVRRVERAGHGDAAFLLRAIERSQPEGGLEYAQRCAYRSKHRAPALLAIAAYPAELSFPALMDEEARHGPEATRPAFDLLLRRQGDELAALPLPPGAREQEHVIDQLFAHGSKEAYRILLSWALRSQENGPALQPAERERLILASAEWAGTAGGDEAISSLLAGALPKLLAENDALAAASCLALSQTSSVDSVIDTLFGGASSPSKESARLRDLLSNPRRIGSSTLLLRLRRLLRRHPVPSTPPLEDRDRPLESLRLSLPNAS